MPERWKPLFETKQWDKAAIVTAALVKCFIGGSFSLGFGEFRI